MADNIRRPARTRMWRRIAIITASVSTLAIAAFVVISFLPKGGGTFSIRVDNPQSKSEIENDLFISLDSKGEEQPNSQTYIVDNNPLDSVLPTTAESVENYLKSCGELRANDNWSTLTMSDDGTTTTQRGLAQVYTVYLENKGQSNIELKYTVNLDSYSRKLDNDILDYFRILIQTEVVDKTDTLYNYYFGRANNNPNTKSLVNELDNKREPISTRVGDWNQDKIIADYRTNDKAVVENGYCYNFQEISDANKTLVLDDDVCKVVVKPGERMRFTYASFFEGNDMDCHGYIPSGSFLLLSLHFGV